MKVHVIDQEYILMKLVNCKTRLSFNKISIIKL